MDAEADATQALIIMKNVKSAKYISELHSQDGLECEGG